MLYKENRPYLKNITAQAYSGLRTDNHSPIWWKEMGSQVGKCPEGPDLRPLPALPSIFLALEKEFYFILNKLWPQE